jgi:DNA-binding response OmpR family regulator
VRWLRQKIERDPSNPKRLETVRGVGYRLVVDAAGGR